MARKQRERVKVSKDAWKKAIKIFRFLKPYKIKFSIGLVFLLLSSASSMLFPGLMGKLVDANSEGGVGDFSNLGNINTVALILFAVFIVQAIFSFFRILLFSQVTENMLADLRKFTYKQLIMLPMSFYNTHRVGELNSRISADISLLQETFTTTVAEFLRQIFIIIAGIAFLSLYSGELTLLMLAVLPLVSIAAVIFGKKVRGLSKKTQDEVANSNVIVEETLTAIAAVKSFMNEQFEFFRYGKSTDNIKQLGIKNAVWRGLFASFIILAMFGSIVLVIWYGMRLKLAGEISTGDLMSFIIYSVFVGASFGGIADLFTQIQKTVGATERLLEIIDEEVEVGVIDNDSIHTELETIEFINTSFSYPSRKDTPVLENISFTISRGEKVAIVGPSGSGKSTLTNLLLQFYRDYEGSILLNGEELKQMPLSKIRSVLGIVPQEVLLFGGSIRENIAYGNTKASQAQIETAARIANAEEFIVRFPTAYDTLVGERGVQLSGGQRQRIAIARAVLRDPALLILDEATSSLDSTSEALIQDALEKVMADRTNLIIAHRLSTVKNADKIIVLHHGKLVEVGHHNDLIALENGYYRELSQVQLA